MPKDINDAGTASTLGVSAYGHPDQLPTDALRLMEYAKRESIELGPSWYRNLVNTVYPNDSGVCFYVLRRDGKPVVVLPLRISKSFFGRRAMSLSNYYTSLYSPAMEDSVKVGELAYLINAVKRAQAPLSELRLAPMDPDSDAYGLWYRGLMASGMAPFKFFAFGNWYLPVTGDWPVYLKDRPGALRSTIKRMTKKFASDGGTLELFTGSEQLEKAVAAFQTVYAKSWKQAEPFPEFVPGLIRLCAERGWLRLGVAWLNGKPIAAQMWIAANRKASIFKMAYDEDFKPYAPGTLVTAMLMERVMQTDKVLEVDYLIGDDPYKKTWMSHRRERWGLIAYNPMGVLGLIGLSREIAGRAWKAMSRCPTQPSLP